MRFILFIVAGLVGLGLSTVPNSAASEDSADSGRAGAHYVGDATCMECHDDMQLAFDNEHARIERFEVRGHQTGCEGCHGPGSAHVEDTEPSSIQSFAPAGVGDASCMECHEYKGMQQWHASTHRAVEVGCSDCHATHGGSTALTFDHSRATDLLNGPTVLGDPKGRVGSTCVECHADSVAQFELPHRHPLREGRMDCQSCHNPHGAGEAMLKSRFRRNEVCYTCHQQIEGPHVFEHAPVQEDCSICHAPHGSVVPKLLVANQPALCLQCHDYHFHAGYRGSDSAEVDVGGIERENPFGAQGFSIGFTTNCTQCHTQVHGSDLPSQAVPGLGRGLTH